VHRVRSELSDERIHVVQWHAETTRYIAEALGLGYVPPMTLLET
jgi:transcription antitermination factor NusA-like protein